MSDSEVKNLLEQLQKKAQTEANVMVAQARWLRHMASLLDAHKSFDGVAAALADMFGENMIDATSINQLVHACSKAFSEAIYHSTQNEILSRFIAEHRTNTPNS